MYSFCFAHSAHAEAKTEFVSVGGTEGNGASIEDVHIPSGSFGTLVLISQNTCPQIWGISRLPL